MPPTTRAELEALMHALNWQRQDARDGRRADYWERYSDSRRIRELFKDYNLAWRTK